MKIGSDNSCVLVSIFSGDNLYWIQESLDSIDLYTVNKVYLGVDGPIDKSILSYLDKLDQRYFKIFKFEQNRGLAFVLNDLIKEALRSDEEYQLFFRVDADDINLKERFINQKDYMNKNLDIDILGSNAIIIDSYGQMLGNAKRKSNHKNLVKDFPLITPFIHPSVCMRRSVVENEKYPTDTIRNEDTSMWAKLILGGYKLANLDENLIKYRLLPETIRRRTGIKKSFIELKIRFKYLKGSKELISWKAIMILSIFLSKVILPNALLRIALDLRENFSKSN